MQLDMEMGNLNNLNVFIAVVCLANPEENNPEAILLQPTLQTASLLGDFKRLSTSSSKCKSNDCDRLLWPLFPSLIQRSAEQTWLL